MEALSRAPQRRPPRRPAAGRGDEPLEARGLQREAAGVTALTLSVLGLVAVVAFWAGLTPILAGGGALLGWAGRNADRGRGTSGAAVVIGALAGHLVVYLADTLV